MLDFLASAPFLVAQAAAEPELEPGAEPAPLAAAPIEPTTRLSVYSLPHMFAETTGGGNLAFALRRRSHIGVTGYGSSVIWLAEGIDLDFQEFSRYPYNGSFGAVGADAAYGIGRYDFFAEVTRSFDKMPDRETPDGTLEGGGGFAGILRWVTTFQKYNELETSLRYYDESFKNPYARPIAAPDEFEGVRARDEMGLRLRYTARLKKRLNLRATTDFWRSPSEDSSGSGGGNRRRSPAPPRRPAGVPPASWITRSRPGTCTMPPPWRGIASAFPGCRFATSRGWSSF